MQWGGLSGDLETKAMEKLMDRGALGPTVHGVAEFDTNERPSAHTAHN